ncbi:MAG: hypothetical protein A3I32_03200 [Candidatus Yanofskybacteria bacterium RIFCSPLOWO2_02_FULL_45_10]|uniref:Polymerase beta nucleotidyltransferase domain-containing protein n=2 Tax=Candidatus Yanofskyibacteriota TaxID=1752733 RepID=A0A1F8G697_9BACT|nr:MAG: hypothetical protein A3F25_02265 [Candidatus Yanofskybacteria bacterium RIFCSPHIGHO2_12_FULL_45_19b]OGN32066.1 MAG: hypothetical protein A3I32_03200 [Candidatus Yanofskybacteria bacterium RIFCSPLOWO2_02_FULL_45_10]
MVKAKHKKTKVKKRKRVSLARPRRKTKRPTRRVTKPAKHASGVGAPRYVLNRDFQFIQELRDLILKSSPAEKSEIAERLQRIGRVKLAVISGIFLNKENPETLATDLFIVADYIDRRKFQVFIKYLEAETGGEVRFVIMEKEEFQYRLSMFDRFVRVLLEGPHEKLINRLGV